MKSLTLEGQGLFLVLAGRVYRIAGGYPGLGGISGTSLNPARSFGPAFVTGVTAWQWIYWLAPPLGTLLAVGAFRFVPGDVLTGKLFHVPSYRSIFKHVAAPSRKEDGLA